MGIAVVIALLLVEGAMRLRQWLRYGSTRPAIAQLTLDSKTGLMIPLATEKVRLDSHGFRSPEVPMPKPAGTIRLAFTGASTTFCNEVSGNEATWAYLVVDSLRARYPGARFDFINASVAGYDLRMSRKNLALRVAPMQPDLILYYEATNDLSKDSRELAARAGLFKERAEDPSALAKLSVTWYLIEKNWVLRQRVRQGMSTSGKLIYNADSLAHGFEARLADYLRAAQAIAPLAAVATFSHKVRRDQPPEVQMMASNTSLYYAPYMSVAGLLDGFDAYNRAIHEAASETGALLIEGEDTIPGDDEHFRDSVHFSDVGSRAMANRVAAGLIASPEFNRLVARNTPPH